MDLRRRVEDITTAEMGEFTWNRKFNKYMESMMVVGVVVRVGDFCPYGGVCLCDPVVSLISCIFAHTFTLSVFLIV